MAVSTSQDFNLDIDRVIEDAFLSLGGPPITGGEAATARRTLNMILADWQNRGILLWTTQLTITSLASSSVTYNLGTSVVDVLQGVMRETTSTSSGITYNDLEMNRITMEQYEQITSKATKGRPLQFAIHRQRDNPEITFWPTPDKSNYSARLWTVRRFFDFDKSADDPDVPYRFLPCLVTGLAYNMALKRPGVPDTRVALLKAKYDEELARALEEDRQRADMYMLPKIRVI